MSGFSALKPGIPHDPALNPGSGFSKIKRPLRGQYYTPDTIELMSMPESVVTRSGYETSNISGYGTYQSTGVTFKAYTYLATGRFFSTKVSPSEYGDGDVFDGLIAIIHTEGYPEGVLDQLIPTAIVKVTRQGYTSPGTLYRIDTGNPYPGHVEMKMVPVII